MIVFLGAGPGPSWMKVLREGKIRNVLMSYHYLRKEKDLGAFMATLYRDIPSVFLDSGAYSADTQGAKIDLGEYIDFLQRFGSHAEVIAPLDVIGDWRASERNLRQMEAAGISPIPVFHEGSPVSVIEEMISEYEYIGIGGIVKRRGKGLTLSRFLDNVFSRTRDRTKVHGFGITTFSSLTRYPFYSVDSTSWTAGSKFSEVHFLRGGRFVRERLGTKSRKDPRGWGPRSLIGANLTDLPGQEVSTWKERLIHNAREWQRMEAYLTALWAKRGITWHAKGKAPQT
jgi:hypothetical protein